MIVKNNNDLLCPAFLIDNKDINKGILTLQKNGTTLDTFAANSDVDKTVNIEIPTVTFYWGE